jgi:uncharacterized phiE125 gp8 family phage protein
MPYKVITAPSVEPVTLDEAKNHCRVDGTEDDALIASLIVAARESAEHEIGRALCTQTRELILDSFPPAFVLRGSPIQSVVSVRYLDSDSVEVELDPQDYQLDNASEPGYVVPAYGKAWPASFPVPNAVRVRYVCGYGVAADVPAAIKSWILLAVGTLHAQRETVSMGLSSLPDRFWHRLLDPFRIYEGQ